MGEMSYTSSVCLVSRVAEHSLKKCVTVHTMEKTPKKTPSKPRRTQNKNLQPPWKKGESGNRNGRPKGQRNYSVICREALEKIANSNNMTAAELESIIIESGIERAIKGDFRFYKDVLDRLHGKPVQSTDVASKDEKIEGITVTFV